MLQKLSLPRDNTPLSGSSKHAWTYVSTSTTEVTAGSGTGNGKYCHLVPFSRTLISTRHLRSVILIPLNDGMEAYPGNASAHKMAESPLKANVVRGF